MNIKEQIANRQKANLAIADMLEGTVLNAKYGISAELRRLAEEFPQQRCGQLITNYIVPEYRFEPSNKSRDILNQLFPGNPDPFYEESVETLERIKCTPVCEH